MPKRLECCLCNDIFNDIETHEFSIKTKKDLPLEMTRVTVSVLTRVTTACEIGPTADDYICRKCAKKFITKIK